MNKEFAIKITSLGLALLCGAAFALSACGNKTDKPDESTDSGVPTERLTAGSYEQDDTLLPVITTAPDDGERKPVGDSRAEMMMEYYYDLGMQVYNWMYGELMAVTVDSGEEADGVMYYPVVTSFEPALLDGAKIETFDDLKNYIYTLFDTPLADKLMAKCNEIYRDVNGRLHRRLIDIEPADTAEETASVTAEAFVSYVGSTKFRYTIKETTVIEGESSIVYHDYIYSKTDNGWRWTAFPII